MPHPLGKRTLQACGALMFACISLSTMCRAQDPATAAKEEQSRTQAETKKQKHVYTEEDLSRSRILTPEDRARVEARRREQAAPEDAKPAEPLDANANDTQIPLGDVARRLRKEKRAARVAPTPGFHLPFEQPVLASPALPVLPVPARPHFTTHPAAPITVAPKRPDMVTAPALKAAPLRRVDPFARRLAPAVPVAPAMPVTPALAPSPSAPKAHTAERTLPPVQAPGTGTVIVERGDSLWKLAERTLGQGARWQELLAANPQITNPDAIVAGSRLHLPGQQVEAKITVQRGDTMSKIAQSYYGRLSAWRCIAQANPQIANANLILEGQALHLPSSCRP